VKPRLDVSRLDERELVRAVRAGDITLGQAASELERRGGPTPAGGVGKLSGRFRRAGSAIDRMKFTPPKAGAAFKRAPKNQETHRAGA
jgi:hypothetical protein